jgi:hypothetical protein
LQENKENLHKKEKTTGFKTLDKLPLDLIKLKCKSERRSKDAEKRS